MKKACVRLPDGGMGERKLPRSSSPVLAASDRGAKPLASVFLQGPLSETPGDPSSVRSHSIDLVALTAKQPTSLVPSSSLSDPGSRSDFPESWPWRDGTLGGFIPQSSISPSICCILSQLSCFFRLPLGASSMAFGLVSPLHFIFTFYLDS